LTANIFETDENNDKI